jgi:hypothetical protein
MRRKKEIKEWSLVIGKVEKPKPLSGFDHMKSLLRELLQENLGSIKDFDWDEYEMEFSGTMELLFDSQKMNETSRDRMTVQHKMFFTIQTGLDLDKQIENILQQKERARVAAIASMKAMYDSLKNSA